MNSLEFRYQIVPYETAVGDSPLNLEHTEQDVSQTSKQAGNDLELEQTAKQIYYYHQSYFKGTTPPGILPPFTHTRDSLSESEDFCINTEWKTKNANLLSVDTFESFEDLSSQPTCSASTLQTQYSWDTFLDPSEGLSFQLVSYEKNQEFSCLFFNSTCELNCQYSGGVFNDDDQNCYQMKKLSKLCVAVDLTYLDNMSADEAQGVTDVKTVDGCFADGNVAQYETVNVDSNEEKQTFRFDSIPIEVRHTQDPQNAFYKGGTSSGLVSDFYIFFWLSMASLIVSIVLIFWLTIYFCCYLGKE